MAKKKEASTKKATKTTKTTSAKKAKKAPTKKVTKVAAKKVATKKAVAPKKSTPVKKVATPKAKAAPKKIKDETQQLADAIVEGILEVKGRNISLLNLKEIHNRVCDYFIICQADSNTQVNAIANSVEEMVKKLTGERPYRKEGFENSEWILVDYVTVVVHIFQTQIRNFYNLESLWADAEITEIAFDK
jgi:ribosome-associated protein